MTITISHRRTVNGYPSEPTLHEVAWPAAGVPVRDAVIALRDRFGALIQGRVVGHLYSESGVVIFVEQCT